MNAIWRTKNRLVQSFHRCELVIQVINAAFNNDSCFKKGTNNIVLVILLGFLSFTLLAQNTTTPKTYAVVVGISSYQNPAFAKLEYAAKDATMFATYLQSKAGGNMPVEQIKLLVNEEATVAAIYDALNWLEENCKPNDVAYFYFSGHGDKETNNELSRGYLLAYNTPANNYLNNAVSIEDINSNANKLTINNKANVILITDACHTGKLAGDFYKGKQLAASELQAVLNNEVRLAACKFDEEAAEGINWGGGRGAFSFYLLSGLNGLADTQKEGKVRLKQLDAFLDSAFAADKYLLQQKHVQHPVTDGNPNFILSRVDDATLQAEKKELSGKAVSSLPASLQSFKPVGVQPLEYFFGLFKRKTIDNVSDFKNYISIPPLQLPLQLIDDCINYQQLLNDQADSLRNIYGNDYDGWLFANIDSLEQLKKLIHQNSSLIKTFNERLVQLIHGEAQDMVNAYLSGDLAELEKRQYYNTGKRNYNSLINQLVIAMQLVSPEHYLARLIKVQSSYISGLVNRLQLVTDKANATALLKRAFINQQKALTLEPLTAAYIHNEMGNLYIYKKMYDSANWHFTIASAIAPNWAIPWSNKIRVNLALQNMAKANEAIQKADSLQPGMAYVLMNAGLVKEQQQNLLAAESDYLQAIAKNDVHFLPYERLGKIYIDIGDYEAADKRLAEAAMRKKSFGVNDESFAFGLELGGLIIGDDDLAGRYNCDSLLNATGKNNVYITLVNTLHTLDSFANNASAIEQLQQLLQQQPDMPLAYHYLGKALYQQQQWSAAKSFIQQAIKNYQAGEGLQTQLRQSLTAAGIYSDCLLQKIMYYQYSIFQDYHLLAAIYEKENLPDSSILQYNIITAIENERQQDQATFKGFEKGNDKNIFPPDLEMQAKQYEQPIKMAGYIKASMLYEKTGRYKEAEATLLKQVANNRLAGKTRMNSGIGPSQMMSHINTNYYWLNINRVAEAVTYNFYQRMLALFPRDHYWHEQAGFFLYNRLSLSFTKVPLAQQPSFYKSIGDFAYPFLGNEEGPEQTDVIIKAPVIEEQITVKMETYNPVKKALTNLENAVTLSGEVQPAPYLLEAMATINSWMDNREAAVDLYKQAVAAKPNDIELRNKMINYCVTISRLTDAMDQLNILYQSNKTTTDQNLQLADYLILDGSGKKAATILAAYKPVTVTDQITVKELYAKMNWLTGNYSKALSYLSGPLLLRDITDDWTGDSTNYNAAKRLYSIARLYALMQQNIKAISILKQSLDNGFPYKYVLDNDKAWSRLQQTANWKKLLAGYHFDLQYTQKSYYERWNSVVDYRIPDTATATGLP